MVMAGGTCAQLSAIGMTRADKHSPSFRSSPFFVNRRLMKEAHGEICMEAHSRCDVRGLEQYNAASIQTPIAFTHCGVRAGMEHPAAE